MFDTYTILIFSLGFFCGAFVASKEFRLKVYALLNRKPQNKESAPGKKPEANKTEFEVVEKTSYETTKYRPKNPKP